MVFDETGLVWITRFCLPNETHSDERLVSISTARENPSEPLQQEPCPRVARSWRTHQANHWYLFFRASRIQKGCFKAKLSSRVREKHFWFALLLLRIWRLWGWNGKGVETEAVLVARQAVLGWEYGNWPLLLVAFVPAAFFVANFQRFRTFLHQRRLQHPISSQAVVPLNTKHSLFRTVLPLLFLLHHCLAINPGTIFYRFLLAGLPLHAFWENVSQKNL